MEEGSRLGLPWFESRSLSCSLCQALRWWGRRNNRETSQAKIRRPLYLSLSLSLQPTYVQDRTQSATKFTKLTFFRDDLAKTTKLTIFRDGLAKTAKFAKLTICRKRKAALCITFSCSTLLEPKNKLAVAAS